MTDTNYPIPEFTPDEALMVIRSYIDAHPNGADVVRLMRAMKVVEQVSAPVRKFDKKGNQYIEHPDGSREYPQAP